MFNPTFIKYLREQPLLMSDNQRDEGSSPEQNKLVRSFNNLQSFFVAKHYYRKQAVQFAKPIIKHYPRLVTLDNKALSNHFYQALEYLIKHQSLNEQLNVVFACVGEVIKRCFGFYPHDVQYLGAMMLLQGRLAEMQTGEGKTIVACIAATIAAASGAAVHVLSTNEYLASRDQAEMQPVFDFFNISSGSVISDMQIDERIIQYRKQICYVSASELVFDVLKDEMSIDNKISRRKATIKKFISQQTNNHQLIVPALHFCIVDEADSVLIDEASTPLIISQEGESIMEDDVLYWAIEQAKNIPKEYFILDKSNNDVRLTANVLQTIKSPPLHVRPMWQTQGWQEIIIKKALTALHLFHKDEHYILVEDKVVIVDESTGRPMPDRSWEQGLHQLIEIKEGVEISKTRFTIAQITFQRFFKRYILLSGLTGTVTEVSREMWHVYGLKICVIPPNRKNRRQILTRLCYHNTKQKWQAVATEAITKSLAGQPVLIGTRSVEASETIYQLITEMLEQQFNHVTLSRKPMLYLLNARQNQEEAEIVAKAGMSSTITIATNMAGRGTDIKLDTLAKQKGGLHVILTEHHDSKRIDRQLIGRSARQGDIGSCREIVCFEDGILTSHPNRWQWLGSRLSQWLPWLVINRFCYNQAIIIAQKRSQKHQYEVRMATLKQDLKRQKQIGFIGQLY